MQRRLQAAGKGGKLLKVAVIWIGCTCVVDMLAPFDDVYSTDDTRYNEMLFHEVRLGDVPT